MTDWIEELERLGELREKGLLSEEEFEAKKSELLSSERGSPVQQVETILKWAPIKQKYVKGSLENFLGGSAVSAEVLDSVGKSIAISLAENFPGNLNREEIQIITTVGPSLLKSPEAIKLINQIYAGAAKRNQTILKEVSNKVQGMYKENKSVVDIREEIVRFMDQRKYY